MANERTETPQPPRPAVGQPTVKLDDSNLKSSYANVAYVSSTRDEIVLVFGINQAWERGQREVTVQLSDRVILSPFAAKRLVGLLTNVIHEYESRFGTLQVDTRAPGDAGGGESGKSR